MNTCVDARWAMFGKHLTHLSLGRMTAISQTISLDAFSWMKSFVFWFEFHWNLFIRVQLPITEHWFRYGLATNRRQTIIWTNADPIHWRIYAALGGDKLMDLPAHEISIMLLSVNEVLFGKVDERP